MATTFLKEIDGQVVLVISPEVVAELSLTSDSSVDIEVEDGSIIVQTKSSRRRKRYKLSELLADWDQIPKDPEEDRVWLESPPVGRELL